MMHFVSSRVLMRAYVLILRGDTREAMWCPLQYAARHLTVVDAHAREAARVRYWLHPRIPEAEMSVRKEWHAVSQAEPNLSPAALIELVGQRRSIWPSV